MFRVALLSLLAQMALAAASASGGMTTTISDTQPIIDWPLCRCGIPLPGVLDFALFDFTGQGELCSVAGMEFSLTMQDGDTGVGEFDRGNLTLGLDGIDTGIKLDGFNQGQELSLNFSLDPSSSNWMSQTTIDQILNKLNEDGQLFASIIDATPDDNNVNLYSIFDATLKLTGTVCTDPVPEPTAFAIWGLVGAAVVWCRRRFRGKTVKIQTTN